MGRKRCDWKPTFAFTYDTRNSQFRIIYPKRLYCKQQKFSNGLFKFLSNIIHNISQKTIITLFQISQGNLIKRYSSQQEENVWDQLLYGIRYLDFRVSYHANTQEKFWLNHDLVQMNPLYKAVQVI